MSHAAPGSGWAARHEGRPANVDAPGLPARLATLWNLYKFGLRPIGTEKGLCVGYAPASSKKEWRRSPPSSGGPGDHHDPRSGRHLPPNERDEVFQIEGLLQDGAACVFEKLVGFRTHGITGHEHHALGKGGADRHEPLPKLRPREVRHLEVECHHVVLGPGYGELFPAACPPYRHRDSLPQRFEEVT